MLLVVVILLVSFVITPLIDLVLSERVRLHVKVIVYLLTLAWVLYILLVGRVV